MQLTKNSFFLWLIFVNDFVLRWHFAIRQDVKIQSLTLSVTFACVCHGISRAIWTRTNLALRQSSQCSFSWMADCQGTESRLGIAKLDIGQLHWLRTAAPWCNLTDRRGWAPWNKVKVNKPGTNGWNSPEVYYIAKIEWPRSRCVREKGR